MNIYILADRVSNVFRKLSVGFYDRIGNLTLGFTKKTHKSNIYVSITEAFSDICDDARFVLMDSDSAWQMGE